MVPPVTLHDLATASDKRTFLQNLLKQIVGSRPRKEALLKAGGLDSLIELVDPHSAGPNHDDLSTEAAAVLAALSLPTLDAVQTLASSNVYQVIAEAFATVYRGHSPSEPTSSAYHKRLDVHLRALKTLFHDLVSATSSASAHSRLSSTSQSGNGWKCGGGKGKEKEEDVSMTEENENGETLDASSMLQALRIIYDLGPVGGSSSTHLGPFSFSASLSASRLSPTLDALLDLLVDSAQPDHPGSRLSGSSQRMRAADHICTLLSQTVRGHDEQQAIAAGGRGKETLAALRRLVEAGSDKVQEGALYALTAIIRGSHVAFLSLLEIGGAGTTAERLHPFFTLAQSPTPSIRLAAITFCSTASKLSPSSSAISLDPSILLSLIEKNQTLRGPAAHTFAYLISKNPEAQKRAATANCFDVFRRVLGLTLSVSQLVALGAPPLEEQIQVREGILKSLASLTADSEVNRRLLLDAHLLSYVLDSLVYPAVSIRATACQVVRALSRSVNVLRTDLVESHAESSLIQLLRADEDLEVQTTATAIFANLLLEFSPMRNILVDAGCIPRLCRLALDGENENLKLNALWAIKNAVYQSSKSFKQDVLLSLTWADLALISEPNRNQVLAEQALGIIRNLTCVTNNEVVSILNDFGEDETLELFLKNFIVGNAASEAVIQSLYCLNNIATSGEAAQLAIASRTPILRYLLLYLDHPAARTRTASLWVLHNLVYRRGCPSIAASPRQRRPHEIVEKLRVLGLEAKLRALERDAELDVRERVRDIREAM